MNRLITQKTYKHLPPFLSTVGISTSMASSSTSSSTIAIVVLVTVLLKLRACRIASNFCKFRRIRKFMCFAGAVEQKKNKFEGETKIVFSNDIHLHIVFSKVFHQLNFAHKYLTFGYVPKITE